MDYDLYSFGELQKKYKKLWLSNNVSTMCCQIVDTLVFVFITYIGTMDTKTIIELIISIPI